MAGQPRASSNQASRPAVHLTPTESAVLTLLPTHRTLAAIGDRLGVSRPTVKTHVHHIYEKLGAKNRAEAVELAESAGLLPTAAKCPVGGSCSPVWILRSGVSESADVPGRAPR